MFGIAHFAKIVFDEQIDVASDHIGFLSPYVVCRTQGFGLPWVRSGGWFENMFVPARGGASGQGDLACAQRKVGFRG